MAINDAAVVTPARGYIFTAAVGTAAPTPAEVEAYTPGGTLTGWVDVGHTSRDELPEFGSDGGDREVRGTWQNESLKSVVTEVPVDYVSFRLHQADEQSLAMYYGVANSSATVGMFSVADMSVSSTEKALTIIIIDGTTHLGFHATRTSISRDDAIGMEIDGFMEFPVRATILKNSTDPLFSWIGLDTGVNPS